MHYDESDRVVARGIGPVTCLLICIAQCCTCVQIFKYHTSPDFSCPLYLGKGLFANHVERAITNITRTTCPIHSFHSQSYDRSSTSYKTVLHTVRPSLSSFSFQYHLFLIWSSTSCVPLLPRLRITSILSSNPPSITCNLLQRQFSTQCDPVLQLSVSSIISFHFGHIPAAYLFFRVFVSLLSFPPTFLP